MNNINELNYFIFTTLIAVISTIIMVTLIDLTWMTSIIYAHVGLGSLAFIIGAITLFSKKGAPLHKLTGRVFYYSMTVSVSISLLVALMPGHISPTMFHIAVLSLYFLIGGKRSLLFKKPQHNVRLDQILALIVIVTSIAVMAYSILIEGRVHILRTVFGTIGIVFGGLDLSLFSDLKKIKRRWLFLHLSKMIGGYTAAVTAFFVAQNILFGYFNWFAPSLFAVSYVVYWALKQGVFKATPSLVNQSNPKKNIK